MSPHPPWPGWRHIRRVLPALLGVARLKYLFVWAMFTLMMLRETFPLVRMLFETEELVLKVLGVVIIQLNLLAIGVLCLLVQPVWLDLVDGSWAWVWDAGPDEE